MSEETNERQGVIVTQGGFALLSVAEGQAPKVHAEAGLKEIAEGGLQAQLSWVMIMQLREVSQHLREMNSRVKEASSASDDPMASAMEQMERHIPGFGKIFEQAMQQVQGATGVGT